jgi:uncharacterized NAD(P)/FAD-binding protein YdhS
MAELSIAIVGAGPRALNVIERISWQLTRDPALPNTVVHLIDPGEPCAGVHPADQSHELLTNTLASQVTLCSLVDPDDPASAPTGPSFTEWACSEGYRRFGSVYRRSSDGGEPIGDLDYLPRAMLGEYLRFAFETIVQRAPHRLRVVHYRELAVNATEAPCSVQLQSGRKLYCDAAVLATGHCELRATPEDARRQSFVDRNRSMNDRLCYIRNPYPISRLHQISAAATVLVQGLGLTAYDVIAELTAGRGGQFVGEQGGLRYVRSGNEPRILLFSRQSLPYNARGINEKGVNGGHQATFLTGSAVNALRSTKLARTGECRLDFETEIMPLLRKEMAFAYRCALEERAIDAEGFVETPGERAMIDRIIHPDNLLGARNFVEFRSRLTKFLHGDLDEARRGNVSSALKAATDSIRDLRAGLVAAVEFGGLLPDSHRFVVEHFVPLTNRITFGPPLQRNAELLALIDAGVVDWAGGPGARCRTADDVARFVVETPFESGVHTAVGDVLIVARVFGHRPLEEERELSRNLVGQGIARPFYNGDYHPHGLDIDRNMRLLRADGTRSQRLWALGFVVEGPRFHTHALPRPGRRSTQLSDAAELVDDMLRAIARPQREAPAVRVQRPEPIEEKVL